MISYADYAIAMVDEAENGRHFNERISVTGNKKYGSAGKKNIPHQ